MKHDQADVVRQAKTTAAIYKSLALELLSAGATLEKAGETTLYSLPAVTAERLAEAMRAGMLLHYLADRATAEGAPIGAG